MKLVIVEYPHKFKTIAKYLGKGYEVVDNVGHINDLGKGGFGVDVDHDFKANYVIIKNKFGFANELKYKASKAEQVNSFTIDFNRFESQEARLIIDHIICFKLSSLLQKKIHSRSAGRVQSATLKLISDHDKEIGEFKPEEYWTLSLDISKGRNKLTLLYDEKKIDNKKENDEVLNKLSNKAVITDIKTSEKIIESKPPFTTSIMVKNLFSYAS